MGTIFGYLALPVSPAALGSPWAVILKQKVKGKTKGLIPSEIRQEELVEH